MKCLLDCLSMAVNYWTTVMDVDQDQAGVEHRETMLQKDLDRFMENATGRRQRATNWIN